MILVWNFEGTIFNMFLILYTVKWPPEVLCRILDGDQPPCFSIAAKCLELGIVNVSHLLTVNLRENLVYLLGNVLHSNGLRKLI